LVTKRKWGSANFFWHFGFREHKKVEKHWSKDSLRPFKNIPQFESQKCVCFELPAIFEQSLLKNKNKKTISILWGFRFFILTVFLNT
jgi:hypothetical protein